MAKDRIIQKQEEFIKYLLKYAGDSERINQYKAELSRLKEEPEVTDEDVINEAYKCAEQTHTREWEDGFIEGAKSMRDGKIKPAKE